MTYCQMTKLKQFSNKFDLLHSRENSPCWGWGAQCLTSSGALFSEGFWARVSFIDQG